MIISFLIMYVCFVGVTKHTQWRGGDWHRSHWREPSQEKHQSLWTHNTAFHLVLRDAQVIPLFELIWLPLRTFFFVDFANFASACVASSSCNRAKTCVGLIRVIWVCEWWYLWPSDPSRVCFCHPPADSWDKFQPFPWPRLSTNNSYQKMVEWIDNRAASYHVQPDVVLSFDRLCQPQASDIILDPMCGTGAIPLEVRHHIDDYSEIFDDLSYSNSKCPLIRKHVHLLRGHFMSRLLQHLKPEYWQPSFFLRGKPNIACFMFLLNRGPLNSIVPSTLLVTTMTWLLTARSITSATSRSGEQIKAGEDGDIFLLSFSVHFCSYWTFTGVQHLFQCIWIAYWHSALGSVQFTHKD